MDFSELKELMVGMHIKRGMEARKKGEGEEGDRTRGKNEEV